MRGDTAVPLLGDLGHGVTLLSHIWGAGMGGDTGVPYLEGWDMAVSLLGGRDVG